MKIDSIPSPEEIINYNKEVKRLSKLLNHDSYYRLNEYNKFVLTPILENNDKESKYSNVPYRNNLFNKK